MVVISGRGLWHAGTQTRVLGSHKREHVDDIYSGRSDVFSVLGKDSVEVL